MTSIQNQIAECKARIEWLSNHWGPMDAEGIHTRALKREKKLLRELEARGQK